MARCCFNYVVWHLILHAWWYTLKHRCCLALKTVFLVVYFETQLHLHSYMFVYIHNVIVTWKNLTNINLRGKVIVST